MNRRAEHDISNVKSNHYQVIDFEKTQLEYQFELSDIPTDIYKNNNLLFMRQ